jgi:hypothetical protein
MDFGWDHPQAHCQLWIDNDKDIIYIANTYRAQKQQPYEVWHRVKSWAAEYPTAWPHDGLQTEKGSGKTQKAYYEEAGWNMLSVHAAWPDGSNSVEQGLMEMYDRFKTAKLIVMEGNGELLDELMQYHRDETGKIVKVADDLISAVRYAYMHRRYAESEWSLSNQYHYEDDYDRRDAGSLGY